ncbi:MAG: ParB/RepB/Spo0J family partition protein [Pirellulaceae bacterium]
MTKDRRLGKGLAALLGSPLEEDTVVDGEVSSSTPTSPGTSLSLPPQAAAGQAARQRPRSAKTPEPDRRSVTGSIPLAEFEQPVGGSCEINVEEIDNNPFQPRRKFNEEEINALAESIREHQQLQPVLVRRVGTRYQLISGERRLRATIAAGLPTIRAEIREADDRLVAELAIVENLQRKDLDAIEKAMSFRRYLKEHKCKQEDLAKRLKIDRSTIANLMRLLELPEEIQQWVQHEKITAGHARALLPLGEEEQQVAFAQQIIAEGWSVRATERRVSEQLDAEDSYLPNSKTKKRQSISPQVAALEQQLKSSLGTKIEIRQNSRGKGKISINFANNDEFERICAILNPNSGRHAA